MSVKDTLETLRRIRAKKLGEIEELDSTIAELDGGVKESDAIPLAEFLNKSYTESAWLIRNFIPAQSVGILSGEGGVGKSTFVSQLCLCLAAGRDTLGLYVPAPRRILHVLYEGAPRLFQERLRTTVESLKIKDDAAYTWYTSPPMERIHRLGSPGLHAMIEKSKAELVVLDTLGYANQFNENDASEWKEKIMIPAKEAVARHGCAFLLVHHDRKDKESHRGTIAMRDDSDFFLKLFLDSNAKNADGSENVWVEKQKLLVDKEKYAPSKWILDLEYDKRLAIYRKV